MTQTNIAEVVQKLKAIQASRESEAAAPLSSDNPVLQDALLLLKWQLSPPCHQWNYWHCFTDIGGIVPLSLEAVISALEEQCQKTS
jgi:hypothetical protein